MAVSGEKMGRIAITWKKSTIGFPRGQRKTIASLGLRRLNHTVEHDDVPSIRGMVQKVQHLVEVRDLPPSTVSEPADATTSS